jgi:hypothetical protein
VIANQLTTTKDKTNGQKTTRQPTAGGEWKDYRNNAKEKPRFRWKDYRNNAKEKRGFVSVPPANPGQHCHIFQHTPLMYSYLTVIYAS